jgi:hypothetical protein
MGHECVLELSDAPANQCFLTWLENSILKCRFDGTDAHSELNDVVWSCAAHVNRDESRSTEAIDFFVEMPNVIVLEVGKVRTDDFVGQVAKKTFGSGVTFLQSRFSSRSTPKTVCSVSSIAGGRIALRLL